MNEELKDNPFAKWDDKADNKIPTCTLMIYDWINKHYSEKTPSSSQRASAANGCAKKRIFQMKHYLGQIPKGTPITPRARINFTQGDIAETTMVYYIEHALVGNGKFYSEVIFGEKAGEALIQGKIHNLYKQKDLHIHIDHLTIIGHADGFGKRLSDGKWELIECKSASNYGFNDFKKNGPGDYAKQAHALMLSEESKKLGVQNTHFFYLRKETGHMWDRIIDFDEDIASQVKKEFLLVDKLEEMPPPYPLEDYYPLEVVEGKSRRVRSKIPKGKKATFPCSYCPYLQQCHGDHSIEWTKDGHGNNKPTYIFKGVKNEI